MIESINRRQMLAAAAAMATSLASVSALRAQARPRPGPRIIIDNDFAGDPDGLFQLAHHLLCKSVNTVLIVASHLPTRFGGAHSAAEGADKANELLKLMKLDGQRQAIAGSEMPLSSHDAPRAPSSAAAIIQEAMRSDQTEPLVYAAGAGLTDLATAWRVEPRIGRRIKLVWIGGGEHPGLAYPPPGPPEAEFNVSLDPVAAQVIFNDSDIEIWQVPRDTYRQMLITNAELEDLASGSTLGHYLVSELRGMAAKLASIPGLRQLPQTEAYVLGDSPLVTLTALLPPFQPDPSSSRYIRMPTPRLSPDGTYQPRPDGRPMRVYTSIDTRLTFQDMASKFRQFGLSQMR